MKKAFTLIELLVVVLIIGILAAVALPQYQKAVIKSKVIRNLPLMKSILSAQEVYKLETGDFTCDIDSLAIDFAYTEKTESDNSICKPMYKYTREDLGDSLTMDGGIIYYVLPDVLVLDIYATGQSLCYGTGDNKELGDKICQTLGTKKEAPAGNGMPVYVF